MKIATQPNLQLEGLHTHIGTYMLTVNAYAVAARKCAIWRDKLPELPG